MVPVLGRGDLRGCWLDSVGTVLKGSGAFEDKMLAGPREADIEKSERLCLALENKSQCSFIVSCPVGKSVEPAV